MSNESDISVKKIHVAAAQWHGCVWKDPGLKNKKWLSPLASSSALAEMLLQYSFAIFESDDSGEGLGELQRFLIVTAGGFLARSLSILEHTRQTLEAWHSQWAIREHFTLVTRMSLTGTKPGPYQRGVFS